MNRREVAHALKTMGALLEIKGEDSFKTRSYEKAAESLLEHDYDLAELARKGKLTDIPGIGKNLEPKVRELVLEGRSSFLERLVDEVPQGLLDLLRVPGIGPKTARLLHSSLGVVDLTSLRAALEQHLVQGLPGMGLKREELMLKGLFEIERYQGRLSIGVAWPILEDLIEGLAICGAEARIVGETACAQETVSSLDILLRERKGEEPHIILAKSGLFPSSSDETLVKAWDSDSRSFTFNTSFGVPLHVHVSPGDSFGLRSCLLTGPAAFSDALAEDAAQKGYRVTPQGLYRGNSFVPVLGEEDVFSALGAVYVPPEMRHHGDLVKGALAGEESSALAISNVVSVRDIEGDLHIHTTWSDGVGTIEDMVSAARKMGYRYIAITDHATEIKMIRGLTPERLREQAQEVEALRPKYPDIRILTGIEVDILRGGCLYLEDSVLAQLDVVVASVHQDISDAKGDLLTRLIVAAKNPNVDIIGHVTGRVIGRRPGVSSGLQPVFEAAALHGTSIEVNASSARLDVSEELAKDVLEAGTKLAVCTDAHSPDSLPSIRFGVHSVCRRAVVPRRDVMNTQDYPASS